VPQPHSVWPAPDDAQPGRANRLPHRAARTLN
jgi:hypothetical protein